MKAASRLESFFEQWEAEQGDAPEAKRLRPNPNLPMSTESTEVYRSLSMGAWGGDTLALPTGAAAAAPLEFGATPQSDLQYDHFFRGARMLVLAHILPALDDEKKEEAINALADLAMVFPDGLADFKAAIQRCTVDLAEGEGVLPLPLDPSKIVRLFTFTAAEAAEYTYWRFLESQCLNPFIEDIFEGVALDPSALEALLEYGKAGNMPVTEEAAMPAPQFGYAQFAQQALVEELSIFDLRKAHVHQDNVDRFTGFIANRNGPALMDSIEAFRARTNEQYGAEQAALQASHDEASRTAYEAANAALAEHSRSRAALVKESVAASFATAKAAGALTLTSEEADAAVYHQPEQRRDIGVVTPSIQHYPEGDVVTSFTFKPSQAVKEAAISQQSPTYFVLDGSWSMGQSANAESPWCTARAALYARLCQLQENDPKKPISVALFGACNKSIVLKLKDDGSYDSGVVSVDRLDLTEASVVYDALDAARTPDLCCGTNYTAALSPFIAGRTDGTVVFMTDGVPNRGLGVTEAARFKPEHLITVYCGPEQEAARAELALSHLKSANPEKVFGPLRVDPKNLHPFFNQLDQIVSSYMRVTFSIFGLDEGESTPVLNEARRLQVDGKETVVIPPKTTAEGQPKLFSGYEVQITPAGGEMFTMLVGIDLRFSHPTQAEIALKTALIDSERASYQAATAQRVERLSNDQQALPSFTVLKPFEVDAPVFGRLVADGAPVFGRLVADGDPVYRSLGGASAAGVTYRSLETLHAPVAAPLPVPSSDFASLTLDDSDAQRRLQAQARVLSAQRAAAAQNVSMDQALAAAAQSLKGR